MVLFCIVVKMQMIVTHFLNLRVRFCGITDFVCLHTSELPVNIVLKKLQD